jgi:hypothetical protein
MLPWPALSAGRAPQALTVVAVAMGRGRRELPKSFFFFPLDILRIAAIIILCRIEPMGLLLGMPVPMPRRAGLGWRARPPTSASSHSRGACACGGLIVSAPRASAGLEGVQAVIQAGVTAETTSVGPEIFPEKIQTNTLEETELTVRQRLTVELAARRLYH